VSDAGIEQVRLACTVNGRPIDRPVDIDRTPLDFLRDDLGLTGTKGSCLEGECGSCTVILDGAAVNSCLVLAAQTQGQTVETIEGLAHGDKLHVLQDKFLASGAAQCGYCTPGLIMAAKVMLDADPNPSEQAFFEGMEGNICRCTGYAAICEAIQAAAKEWMR
jgi:aerobic carbon-monoxide dehydrogenase small subunit